MAAALRALDRAVGHACKWGAVACLLGLFLLLLVAVVGRMVPALSISGYDEIIEWLFAWMIFLGALALWREGALYRVTVIEAALPGPARRVLAVFTRSLMLLLALVMTVMGHAFVRDAGEITPFLGLDKTWWYMVVPLTGAIMTLYAVAGLWRALTTPPEAEAAGSIIG
ncbi:TRAP transporter small permease [Elioraea rosea]|uniref:TRAP transporter small permease n=1 Tax=Elioraea rosea TaxID=2492390 RepID=UPI001186C971|nr:TRAP transporter small permease subunit [Elioraea rosea]